MTPGEGPIFIGGLSHSGKTELRVALCAHPELSLVRRTGLWDRYFGRFGDLARPANLDRCLKAMTRDERVSALEPDPVRIRRELVEDVTYARLFGLIQAHHAERLGKRRWGEQLGLIERFAAPIFEAFPSARMIHLVRDPRARVAEATGKRHRPGSAGWETARWLRSAELAGRNQARYRDGYLVVRYEALATEPAETLREVCAFIGEDHLPAIDAELAKMRFHGTDERADHVSGPARSDVAFMDLVAASELPRFGYEPARPALSARQQVAFVLVDRPLNRMAMTAWRTFGRGRAPKGVV